MPTSPETTPAGASRPRSPVIGSVLEGWRRVLQAPAITAAVFVLTLLMSLPLAIALRAMLAEHLGSSLDATHAAAGWNQSWAGEFAQQAQGLGRTFTHEILGFGGTVSIVSGLVDREPLNPAIAGAVAAYLALWLFLSGGILDRYARGRPVRTSAFFATCGVYAVRFIPLGAVMLAAYWALFRYVHPFLFERVYPRLIRDVTAEHTAVAWRLFLYAVFGLLLTVCNIAFDYAKVRAVVEDRRSMIGAITAGLRFAGRRWPRVAGVYFLNVLVFLLIIRLWYEAAPRATMSVWASFLITQIYLLLRLSTKLAFMASEVVFFQGELAHAGYVATPVPAWPESASAEAIGSVAGLGQRAGLRERAELRQRAEGRRQK
jgi:hypothetical protein